MELFLQNISSDEVEESNQSRGLIIYKLYKHHNIINMCKFVYKFIDAPLTPPLACGRSHCRPIEAAAIINNLSKLVDALIDTPWTSLPSNYPSNAPSTQ